jgi:hypothetical protein
MLEYQVLYSMPGMQGDEYDRENSIGRRVTNQCNAEKREEWSEARSK